MRIATTRAHGRDVVTITATRREASMLDRSARKKDRGLPLRGLMIDNTALALRIVLTYAQKHSKRDADQYALVSRLLTLDLSRHGMIYTVTRRTERRLFGWRITRSDLVRFEAIPS